jgi:TRAP transporter 4TM/12TM fusion protein
MNLDQLKSFLTLRNLTFLVSIVLFVWLIWYFYTGLGGSRQLATRLVSVAVILQILFYYQQDWLYPRLPATVNRVLVAIYIGIAVYAFYYFFLYFEQVAIWRMGSYTTQDFVVGFLMFLVVMELSRIIHPILFWVNVVLVIYTLYGYLSPIDFFWHPGTSVYRVVTSSTVELSTGIYGLYSQLALTLIAAFLLLAAAARGFEAQSAMVAVMRRLAGRSRHTIPQTAVLASTSVGMVSGSGAANTAVTGSFTIPLMMRYGVPGRFAAAVETAASMGGLIMPPLMAVAGFLMAEFLGVPYWEVVVRGFAVAFVYFLALCLAVYLLSVRLLPADPVQVPSVPIYDQLKTSIFFLGIAFLILLMGVYGFGALRAALWTAIFLFSLLLLAYMVFFFILRDPNVVEETPAQDERPTGIVLVITSLILAYLFHGYYAFGGAVPVAAICIAVAALFAFLTFAVPTLLTKIRLTIETHAEMTSYLTLLLATLGIMIGLFTVTGFINRMGGILLDLGRMDFDVGLFVIPGIVVTILMAWVFGWLAGTGLPPTATYIIVAVVIVRPLQQLGIDPWVAHFFAFLLAIWGELSPPTSLTAAVASRIAESSFMWTMFEALKICLPITFMSFAIFIRSDMVVNPGWLQIVDTGLVAVATCGVTFATFGHFVTNRASDILYKAALALAAFVVMFHPDQNIALLVAAVVAPAVLFGISRHRIIASPEARAAHAAAQPAQ